ERAEPQFGVEVRRCLAQRCSASRRMARRVAYWRLACWRLAYWRLLRRLTGEVHEFGALVCRQRRRDLLACRHEAAPAAKTLEEALRPSPDPPRLHHAARTTDAGHSGVGRRMQRGDLGHSRGHDRGHDRGRDRLCLMLDDCRTLDTFDDPLLSEYRLLHPRG